MPADHLLGRHADDLDVGAVGEAQYEVAIDVEQRIRCCR
jgi:hypothetical protein